MWTWLLGGGDDHDHNRNSSDHQPPSTPSSQHGRTARFFASLLGGNHGHDPHEATHEPFTLATMQSLHEQLQRSHELREADVVELLRVLAEYLIYSDQNRMDDDGRLPSARGSHPCDTDTISIAGNSEGAGHEPVVSAGVFFDYFCEHNMLVLLVRLAGGGDVDSECDQPKEKTGKPPSVAVQVQLLQTLSMLVQNITTRTSLFYLLSNNTINRLLLCPFAVDTDDDVRDWYVTLLKALSLRLNQETVQFFIISNQRSYGLPGQGGGLANDSSSSDVDDANANDRAGETSDDSRAAPLTDDAFPLLTQALRFGRSSENMVQVAVKTLLLNVLGVSDDPRVRRFLLTYEDMAYFQDMIERASELALQIQGLLNVWSSSSSNAMVADKLDEAVDAYLDHCFYLQDVLAVPHVPELAHRVAAALFERHVRDLLAVSLLPSCEPPPQRLSTRLALYLLSRLLGILEYTPLVNATAFMLLSPDAHMGSEYGMIVSRFDGDALLPTTREDDDEKPQLETETIFTDTDTDADMDADPDTELATESAISSALAACDAQEIDTPNKITGGGMVTSSRARHPLSFRAHSSEKCDSPMCYLQIRYSQGEWPVEEVCAFAEPSETKQDNGKQRGNVCGDSSMHCKRRTRKAASKATNWFRLSLVALMGSRDELLAATSLLIVVAVMNSEAVAPRLLDELDIKPIRFQRRTMAHNAGTGVATTGSEGAEVSLVSPHRRGDEQDGSPTQDDVAPDGSSAASSSSATADGEESESEVVQSTPYSHWLADVVLDLLHRCTDVRLLTTQLCAKALLDLTYEGNLNMEKDENPHGNVLSLAHRHWLTQIHSVSTHHVMQSMRGAMADVDLFIYVLEDEYASFQRAPFPLAPNLQSSSPYDFLIPLVSSPPSSSSSDAAFASHQRSTLRFRHPVNEVEVCRKAMRVFLILRRLRRLVDNEYASIHGDSDPLDELVTFRHAHTPALATAASAVPSTTSFSSTSPFSIHRHHAERSNALRHQEPMVSLDGMVYLSCRWREQRFLKKPAKLLMVLNPEVLTFVERVDTNDSSECGVVRFFAPIHRTYASVDNKDDLVLHLTVSSAEPVAGCRSYRKAALKDNNAATLGALKNWHVSMLFDNSEDCQQANAHIELCRAEVRAFKLLKIEASLSAHVQVTTSTRESEEEGEVEKENCSTTQ